MGFKNSNDSVNDAMTEKEVHSLTPFEIFIIIAFIFLVVTVIFNVNIKSDDNSTIRLQRMNVDELWEILDSEEFDDSVKVKAFDMLVTQEKQDKMILRAYEMLYEPGFYTETFIKHIEKYVIENPNQNLAQRIVNDYISKTMPEALWSKIRENWSKTLLPNAFVNSQLLFKGIKNDEERRLSMVIDVLSFDNNSYLFEVSDKYLEQSKTFQKPKLTEKITDGLDRMKLNHADDVIRLSMKIMLNNENFDNFEEFSSKMLNMLKKFGYTRDIRNRLREQLNEIKGGNWISVKEYLLNWIEILDK